MRPHRSNIITGTAMLSQLIYATLFSIATSRCIISAFYTTPFRVTNPSGHRSTFLQSTSNKGKSLKDIKYLGSGPDAVVRPGVVIVAPEHEYDHFLMKSAVFVYAVGLDNNQDMVIRGVIIDHPTAFTIGEMSPNVQGSISNNLLFRGGNSGQDSAMLLHSAGGTNGHIPSGEMIGKSGIYEGGIVHAMKAVDEGLVDVDQCKFFFNYMQFRELELDDLFSAVEDDDSWASLEVPPEYVLDSDLERGEMWMKLRGTVKKNRKSP